MDIIQTVEQIAGKTLEAMGYEIVRVHLSGKVRPILQVIIDRLDGTSISVQDCISASHTLSAILDVEDPIDSSYQLEVSSTGEDRPLTKPAHYIRFVGQPIKLEAKLPIDGQRKFVGHIEAATETTVTRTYLAPDNTLKTQTLAFDDILKARRRPDEALEPKKLTPKPRNIK